jgi:hypothetical protein
VACPPVVRLHFFLIECHAELSTAIDRDMAMTFWLPETEAALAKVEREA